MTQPAKVLGPADVRRLLAHMRRHRNVARDRVIVLLSFKAGLRACEMEIARILAWSPQNVERIRRVYVDDAAVVVALADRIRRSQAL